MTDINPLTIVSLVNWKEASQIDEPIQNIELISLFLCGTKKRPFILHGGDWWLLWVNPDRSLQMWRASIKIDEVRVSHFVHVYMLNWDWLVANDDKYVSFIKSSGSFIDKSGIKFYFCDHIMGSECSVEKDYELDEPVGTCKEWTLIGARRKQDDFKATVFIHEKNRKEKSKKEERIAKAAQVIKLI